MRERNTSQVRTDLILAGGVGNGATSHRRQGETARAVWRSISFDRLHAV
jgi:hypothetical protein